MLRDNRNARGLATARALERAAVALAARDGTEAVTVDRICAEVGVTQRTFFNHFDTKEDALLGLELPRLDEQRAREYLANASVGILSGALGLIQMPRDFTEDPATARARFAIIASSPSLRLRQSARFAPLAEEVQEVIRLKLHSIADEAMTEDAIRAAAGIVATMAATLIIQPGPDGLPSIVDSPGAAAERLRSLEWVWSRLL